MTILADVPTDYTVKSAWHAGRALQSSTAGPHEYDAEFDCLPTVHPGRELFTFSLFILAILTFLVWGGWRLVSSILGWLV